MLHNVKENRDSTGVRKWVSSSVSRDSDLQLQKRPMQCYICTYIIDTKLRFDKGGHQNFMKIRNNFISSIKICDMKCKAPSLAL